jgi:hypothetical protein
VLNPLIQVFYLRVLYDDVLQRPIDIQRSAIGLDGTGVATFGDINGWPLRLPNLVFPYRRALYYMAWYYYDSALKSARSTGQTAQVSFPSPAEWLAIRTTCTEAS